MAKNGSRILDSDTHVGPDMAVLERYLAAEEKSRLAAWSEFRRIGPRGSVTYVMGQRVYRRRLGDAQPDTAPAGYMAGFTGVKRERNPSPRVDHDPAERIEDMDYEGVDVNLTLPSGWFGTWTAGDDVALEQAMYRAYHRWMQDYCSAYPDRLGGVMDRYPELRIGTLEAGHGWLPFWMKRLDEHYDTIRAALPELEMKPSEYVTCGRYFQSIEVPEGGALTNAVADLIGDDVLMYASDYPHGESHFPHTLQMALAWEMEAGRRRKLMWDNAVRFYRRAGLQ